MFSEDSFDPFHFVWICAVSWWNVTIRLFHMIIHMINALVTCHLTND